MTCGHPRCFLLQPLMQKENLVPYTMCTLLFDICATIYSSEANPLFDFHSAQNPSVTKKLSRSTHNIISAIAKSLIVMLLLFRYLGICQGRPLLGQIFLDSLHLLGIFASFCIRCKRVNQVCLYLDNWANSHPSNPPTIRHCKLGLSYQ